VTAQRRASWGTTVKRTSWSVLLIPVSTGPPVWRASKNTPASAGQVHYCDTPEALNLGGSPPGAGGGKGS